MLESEMIVGGICHFEMSSQNPSETRKFIEGLFGWKFNEMPGPSGTYHTIDTGGQPGGGLRQVIEKEPGTGTLN